MRPIDADALLEIVQYRLPVDNKNAEIIKGCVDITRRFIENAPTITLDDLREKGEWNVFGHGREIYAECSECKHIRAAYDAERMKFCPNCGAKMGGGK